MARSLPENDSRPRCFARPRSFAVKLLIGCLLAACSLLAASPARSDSPATVDFNRDIRPILSNNCFTCHGPDEAERQSGLRLDLRDSAIGPAASSFEAIVPGDPEQSELVARITADEDFMRMPPARTGHRLTPREVELLTEWIRQGAPYAEHWAYVKPQRPPLPDLNAAIAESGPPDDTSLLHWPRNEIDHFILARLLRERLVPAAEADRQTLIRRVSLDLTGLPPTPEEVDRFVNDPDAEAYERLIDRLLEKPSFGEHWARQWLDLARYADSAGYADDPPRTIWAYRDWVIRALNDNLPFDQFSIEQLAGDLLPEPTLDQQIATAFHRNTMTNNEGGTDDEEFRTVAVVDRVNTTMTVWMGTTMACAQCHTHKYDPITHEDYFRLFAIFNQTADADRRDESPVVEVTTEEQRRQKAAWQAEVVELETLLSTPTPELLDAQRDWEQQFADEPDWQSLSPRAMQSREGAAMSVAEDGAVHVAAGGKTDVYTLELPLAGVAKPAEAVTAIRLETLPDASLPGGGAGHGGGNFVITRITAALRPDEEAAATDPVELTEIPLAAALADYAQGGFDAAHVLPAENASQKGWAVGGQIDRPHALTLIPAEPFPDADAVSETPPVLYLTIEQLSDHEHHTLGRFRLAVSSDRRAAELARIPPEILTILRTAADDRSDAQQEELTRYFLQNAAPQLQEPRERLDHLKQQLADLKPVTSVPVMQELPEDRRRRTFIHLRGDFLAHGPEVTEGLPAVFPPPPDDQPLNRLTLARWLFDEDNPLTARVIANRDWEAIFGQGLVVTSEDFGIQGDLPSHPELLDWLATELIRLGWDRKAFLKQIVTSATYRQSSVATPEALEIDRDNRLLARGPRFRMSAEMVRDHALLVSGLLSSQRYGPPVRPPQPNFGLTAAFGSGVDWKTSEGEDRYRRGLYTTWRRSSPYPSMVTFDAPNREVCEVRRDRTNTPLQALVTLNDPVYVEAAQALARRLTAAGSTPRERVVEGFRLCVARPPRDAEVQPLVELYQRARDHFADDPAAAQRMATEPLGPADDEADLVELAAWTVVGNVLLNLDEVLMKR